MAIRALHTPKGQELGMTSLHSEPGYPRVRPGPGTARLSEAATSRGIQPFRPQPTFPRLGRGALNREEGCIALPARAEPPGPSPSLLRVHASCGRREQTAAAPEQSLERRSTPTQERETVATAGVGPPRGRGGGESGRLARPCVSESSRGNSKPLGSSGPTWRPASHDLHPRPTRAHGRSQTPPRSPS